MSQREYDMEKRQFIRTGISLPVDYRFIDCNQPDLYPESYKGKTENISGGGILLGGEIPHSSWVPDLLMGKILIAVKIHLEDKDVIKGIGKMAWLERKEDLTCFIGVHFQEITTRGKDKLIEMMLDYHMP